MAKRLEELTPEQEAMLPAIRDEWIQRCLEPRQGDRRKAERAMAHAYQEAGLEPPVLYLWVKDPLAGAHLCSAIDRDGDPIRLLVARGIAAIRFGTNQVHGQVRDQVADQVLGQVLGQVAGQVHGQVAGQVHGQVADQVLGQVHGQVADQVHGQVADQVHGQASSSWRLRVWGQYDGWLSYYDTFARFGVTACDRLRPLIELGAHAGWCWLWDGVAVLTERHAEIHRDDEGRLHGEGGPAISWPSGWGIWCWRGTRVPREWIESPGSIDASAALTWDNVEQRRAAMEIVGWDQILDQVGAEIIDTDPDPEIGTLLKADLPDAPGAQFLRVRCGTGRDFVLPVPEHVQTAIAAQARMWDLPEEMIRQSEART